MPEAPDSPTSVFPDAIGTTNQRVGQILVTGDTFEQADAALAEARAWFAERLVVAPHGVRPRDLRAWQAVTWPERDFGDVLWR